MILALGYWRYLFTRWH